MEAPTPTGLTASAIPPELTNTEASLQYAVTLEDAVTLVFYVPESHLEGVKTAVFAAGAGRWQGYDQCCWSVKGQGQFRPLAGSQPYVGEENSVHQEDEFRVEMLCARPCLPQVMAALHRAHPYEVPAFSVFPMLSPSLFQQD